MKRKKMLALSQASCEKYGCPNCESHNVTTLASTTDARKVECSCGEKLVILTNGIKRSPFGFGEPASYPILSMHPKESVYVKPKQNVSLDLTTGCFFCKQKATTNFGDVLFLEIPSYAEGIKIKKMLGVARKGNI